MIAWLPDKSSVVIPALSVVWGHVEAMGAGPAPTVQLALDLIETAEGEGSPPSIAGGGSELEPVIRESANACVMGAASRP